MGHENDNVLDEEFKDAVDVIQDMDDDTDGNIPTQHTDPAEQDGVETEPTVAEDEWENAMEVVQEVNMPEEANLT